MSNTQLGYFIELLAVMKIKNIQKNILEFMTLSGLEIFSEDSIPISKRSSS